MAKRIFLSPSSQPENTYASGGTNEQEQCRRISDAAAAALERCGFEVINDKTGGYKDRVTRSNASDVDLHVAIHTNAFNGSVTGTRIFYYRDSNTEGKKAAFSVFGTLAPITPGESDNVKPYAALYELSATSAPAVYCECEFHDVPSAARWIIDHVTEIGEAIARGICEHFNVSYIPAPPAVIYRIQVGAFRDRNNAEAYLKTVREDFPQAFIVTAEL